MEAITYSIISPLVLGFSTLGFGFIYLATRYNALYVLTNNIDTKGLAYARALQQLMTGVYLAEICLIGLFAINTAPGPIVLMVVFLVFTALYHALMRHALLPLTRYLPTSTSADAQLELFNHSSTHSYDASKTDSAPSLLPPTESGKMGTRKSSLLSKLFNPARFASHSTVHALIPSFPPPQYTPWEDEHAYYNPAITSPKPVIWIVRDDFGISQNEVRESGKVVNISDELARFGEKAQVIWDVQGEADGEGKVLLERVPVWEKRVDW